MATRSSHAWMPFLIAIGIAMSMTSTLALSSCGLSVVAGAAEDPNANDGGVGSTGSDGALPGIGDGNTPPPNPCLGVTDCSNPICPCVGAPPGWSVLGVVSEMSSSSPDGGGLPATTLCPEGWTNERWIRANPRPTNNATTCSCSCGVPLSNPCLNGTMAVGLDGPTPAPSGDDYCQDGNATLTTTGVCHAVDFPWDSSGGQEWAGITGIPPTPASLACSSNTVLPAIVDDGSKRVCDPPMGSTIPKPPSVRACLKHDGEEPSCPAGYAERIVMSDGITDTRTCAACTCSSSGTKCTAPMVLFYGDANCTQQVRNANIVSVNATTDCPRIQGNLATVPSHYKYTASAGNTTCTPSQLTTSVSGSLSVTSTITVCCAPP